MDKHESWVTVKSNLTINYSRLLIHTLLHFGTVFSLVMFGYFMTGFGKTTFTTKHLMIVRDPNLNITIIQFFSMMAFIIFLIGL